ncbi:MAG: sel1 repeat family protein, partial [Clostridia bacterium]|nr:sel1 repeat family protein [Clostridia bacterium]
MMQEEINELIAKAEAGDAEAQNKLGGCYAKGEGVAQDYAKSLYWCTKAAEQGLAKAQTNLGSCYYFGRGVVQDYTKAVYWYKKAAEQNLRVA